MRWFLLLVVLLTLGGTGCTALREASTPDEPERRPPFAERPNAATAAVLQWPSRASVITVKSGQVREIEPVSRNWSDYRSTLEVSRRNTAIWVRRGPSSELQLFDGTTLWSALGDARETDDGNVRVYGSYENGWRVERSSALVLEMRGINPRLSPDGRYVAYLSAGRLHVSDLTLGSTVYRVAVRPCQCGESLWWDWSPSGRFLVYNDYPEPLKFPLFAFDTTTQEVIDVSQGVWWLGNDIAAVGTQQSVKIIRESDWSITHEIRTATPGIDGVFPGGDYILIHRPASDGTTVIRVADEAILSRWTDGTPLALAIFKGNPAAALTGTSTCKGVSIIHPTFVGTDCLENAGRSVEWSPDGSKLAYAVRTPKNEIQIVLRDYLAKSEYTVAVTAPTNFATEDLDLHWDASGEYIVAW